ncbi:hypothetical protein MJN51_39885, partial [Salmonella enterica subsp. enterica serovar Kentucky]|nr:hypothetical protein [Salmonella enterica subsp. enterica serovar Kentucky]
VPVENILGLAAAESQYGTGRIAREYNNYFSLQAPASFQSGRVKYLLCGHIHQELDLDWNGRRLLASPSTCVQFKPHCANFTLD